MKRNTVYIQFVQCGQLRDGKHLCENTVELLTLGPGPHRSNQAALDSCRWIIAIPEPGRGHSNRNQYESKHHSPTASLAPEARRRILRACPCTRLYMHLFRTTCICSKTHRKTTPTPLKPTCLQRLLQDSSPPRLDVAIREDPDGLSAAQNALSC